ncbi:fibrobacter succinogenes major paralogous domain-containing protein [bacterium]|nr:fibrobacter succinogenes major paralogous domain-containing protein [bacterium]
MKTVTIGKQVWSAVNLNVDHYRNGDPIPSLTGGAAWKTAGSGAWCDYGDDPANSDVYGKLYNWYAVHDQRGLAPAGWHIPSDGEWQLLIEHLGGQLAAGGRLKEKGTRHWLPGNIGAEDSTRFQALPGGYIDCYGSFIGLGEFAHFWSASEDRWDDLDGGEMPVMYALAWELWYNETSIRRGACLGKRCGLSVRCLRD